MDEVADVSGENDLEDDEDSSIEDEA